MRPAARRALAAAAALLVLGLTIGTGRWLGGRFGTDAEPPETTRLPLTAACDPTAEGCTAAAGAARLHFALSPDAGPMAPFEVHVRVEGVAAEAVDVAFEMPGMDMGLNRYRLHRQAPGTWRTKATLPVCGSGRLDWRARVTARAAGKRYEAAFPFRLGGG